MKTAERVQQTAPTHSAPSFERMFVPNVVAVMGVSTNPGAVGSQVVQNLCSHAFRGRIYQINPKYDEINGLPCYAGIDALPETPDVLVIAVAARLVSESISAAGRKGVAFAIILSSGFAETGTVGRVAQEELLRAAEQAGVRLIGPNCQGLMNIEDRIYIGFGAPYTLDYRSGSVSLTSQSGAFGNCLVMGLDAAGVGLRRYVSTGNEAAITSLDCIEHFLDDPKSRVIAGYVEGLRDARRLSTIGSRALELDKPLVLWKVGNSEAGARAAASHTANLAGSAGFYRAVFRQFGIVGVNDIDDMADCVRALCTGRRARSNRIGIVTISGGAGIVLADRCSELGLEVGRFADDTLERLRPKLPEFASLANPLDVTAGAIVDPEGFVAALQAVVDDPSVDMLALALAAVSGKAGSIAAKAISLISKKTDLPILVAWNAPSSMNAEAYSILADAGIPVYASPVRCARGFGAIWEHSAARIRHFTDESEAAQAQPHAERGQSGLQNEFNSKRVLQAYGLPITREGVAKDAETAVTLASDMGFPVVMKLLSADLPHKSDVGGVKIGLGDEEAVRDGYAALKEIAAGQADSVHIDGILVQEMVKGGIEVILGATVDANFGPMVMFGSGGIYAEVFEDVTFRMAPLTRSEAKEMITETRVHRLLQGVRGAPQADINALVDALLALSALVTERASDLVDIDINPLFVLPNGAGVRAADAVVRFK